MNLQTIEAAALVVMMLWVIASIPFLWIITTKLSKLTDGRKGPATDKREESVKPQPATEEAKPLTPEEDYKEMVKTFLAEYGRDPVLEEDNKLRAHFGLPLRTNGHKDEPVPPVTQKVEVGAVATAAPKTTRRKINHRKKREEAE